MEKNKVKDYIMEDTISSGIVAIDENVAHKICSGQVVLTLAVAVKELLENSLDAGATVIDIRLVDQGSTLIEVADNGCGIKEDDFEGIALKHHTSKLSTFCDLNSVETFGFRGEALSSLCSLCGGITVMTCHTSAPYASLLQFDSKGILNRRTSCARQVGTTVSIQSLFSELPVRRKEFLRNLHREFAKMTHLLYAYCLVSTGVRITCVNHNGRKGNHGSIVVATQGGPTVRDNVSCVFGHKQLVTLMDLMQKEAPCEILEEFGLKNSKSDLPRELVFCDSEMEDVKEISMAATPFNIRGCLSTCEHGKGRRSPDRQFFYINSRPCEATKVMKLVNEIYHQYNPHQYPFIFLNVKTDGTHQSGVDVNVTPDKRKIFIENEKLLLATIKASLLHIYASVPRTLQLQNISLKEGIIEVHEEIKKSTISPTSFQSSYSSKPHKTSASTAAALPISEVLLEFPLSSSSHSVKGRHIPKRKCSPETINGIKEPKLNNCFDKSQSLGYAEDKETGNTDLSDSAVNYIVHNDPQFVRDRMKCSILQLAEKQSEENILLNSKVENTNNSINENDIGTSDPGFVHKTNKYDSNYEGFENLKYCYFDNKVLCDFHSPRHEMKEVSFDSGKHLEVVVLDEFSAIKNWDDMKMISYGSSLDHIAKKCRKKSLKSKRKKLLEFGKKVKFMAGITPMENRNAETELQREMTKEMFLKMKIIGQFNLGFVVTQLGPDIFIIDQHASDEKYNFETLQLTTTLQQQPLVVAQPLDLTFVSKTILMENLEVFERNGFKFSFPKEGGTTVICLTSIPFSKNWTFGKEDVDELIFMLQDSPHTNCRPSRVREMFASRACRKSVMIGTALSNAEMRQIVKHMGLIDQPWNCPHGRPTIRHLINLDFIV